MTNKYRSLVLMDFGPSRHSSFGRYCVRCSDHDLAAIRIMYETIGKMKERYEVTK